MIENNHKTVQIIQKIDFMLDRTAKSELFQNHVLTWDTPTTQLKKRSFDRIIRIKRLIKRKIFLPWPEARPKGYHSPLEIANAIRGFRPLIVYPANPVNPV